MPVNRCHRLIYSLLLAALNMSVCRAEDLQRELLVFGSLELAQTRGLEGNKPEIHDALASADVLFSVQKSSFRLFGEYLLTNHESDLERLQLGWEPTSDTVIWLGRFHQPGSVWNHEHHHGRYLQTAISRPSIEDWEDDGGILPQHYTGVLAESMWHLHAGHALQTSFGAGLAPVLTKDGLESLDLLRPSNTHNRFGIQGRLAFVQDELGDSGFGLLFGTAKLNVERDPASAVSRIDHVDLTSIGAYASYVTGAWKFSGTAYLIEADIIAAAAHEKSSFLSSYLQIEYDLERGWHPFVRQEASSGAADDAYLRFFPGFVTSRGSLGLRWDAARRQAITFQTSYSRTATQSFGEFRLQWSAALL